MGYLLGVAGPCYAGKSGKSKFMAKPSSYREQALKILPWVCARCAREFDAKRLRELTVHHKDGNHHNNPPDGSNWELLCIYCHENEHARVEDARAGGSIKEPE